MKHSKNRSRKRLRLAIVSGMAFYEREGTHHMSHQYEVLREIQRYFDGVTYVGRRGGPAASVTGFAEVDKNIVRVCALPQVAPGWIFTACHAPLVLCRIIRAIRGCDVVLAKLSSYQGALGALAGHLLGKVVVTYLIIDPAFSARGNSGLGRIVMRCKRYVRETLWPMVYRSGDLRLYIAPCWAKQYLQPSRAADREYIEASLWHFGRKQSHRGDSRQTLLFVGRMTREKGVGDLLAAAKLLNERGVDYELTLVGSGPELPAMQTLASSLGLDERVRFLGFVPQGDILRGLYERADLFVFPSHTEALPLVLLEAMAAGLPIVTTAVGGIPDLVQDRVNGLLVPPSSPVAIASAVATLVRDAAVRAEMGARNVEKAAGHATPVETKRLCEAIYRVCGMALPQSRQEETARCHAEG